MNKFKIILLRMDPIKNEATSSYRIMKVLLLLSHVLVSNVVREKQTLSQKTGPEEGSTDQNLNPNPNLGFRLRSVVPLSIADISN